MMEQEEYQEEASEYQRTPDDFEADFDLSDTQVPDHPVIVDVDGFGQASARLVQWEVVEKMQDEGEEMEFGADEVARLIREHYESPSFKELRADGVRSMRMVAPDSLLGAIMPGMDAQMQADGSATVDTKN